LAFDTEETTVDKMGEPLLPAGAAPVVEVSEGGSRPPPLGREVIEAFAGLFGQLPPVGPVVRLDAFNESPAEEAAEQGVERLNRVALVARRPRLRFVVWIDLHVGASIRLAVVLIRAAPRVCSISRCCGVAGGKNFAGVARRHLPEVDVRLTAAVASVTVRP